MRIRIALGTAVAVIVLPVLLFAMYSISAASARVTRHEAISQHRAVKINSKLMSYAQAQTVAKLATYSNAVTAQQEATYLKGVAFLTYLKDVNFMKAVALERQQAAQQAAAQQAAAQPAAAVVAAPAPAPATGSSDATSTNTADWACIRQHESGGNYADGGGGAYQFGNGTWNSLTGLPSPAQDYPASVQTPRRSSCTPSAVGSRGLPATSAGCEDRAVDRAPACRDPELRTTPSNNSKGLYQPAAHPAAICQNGRRLPARRSGRECTGRSPPTPNRARRAPSARPTKGGAVRIRIALATAVAVIVVVVPAVLMSLFSSDAAWAQATRHEAVSSHQGADMHHAVRINDKLMSYSQARKVAKMVTYSNAVKAAQQAAFFQAVAAQENTIPAAWVATAICEEGGSQPPVRRVLRDPRVARLRRLPDRRQRGAVGAAGLGGAVRRRTARRTGALPQLLSSSISGLPCEQTLTPGRYPASNMAVTCAMSK